MSNTKPDKSEHNYMHHIAETPFNELANKLFSISHEGVESGHVNWTEVAKYVMHNFQEKPKCNVDVNFTAPGFHQDDMVNHFFALTMKQKMDFARKKYGDGWRDIPVKDLWVMLHEHVEKGDPVDIANFAMFIWWLESLEKTLYRGMLDQANRRQRKILQFLRGNTENVQHIDDTGLVDKPNMSKDKY